LRPHVGKAAADTNGGLHFTIGSAAGHDSPGALDLREDLALAKATLLYADHVKLCSVGSSVLSGIAEYAEAPTEKRARLVVKFLPELQPSFTPDEIHFFEAVVGLRGRAEKRRINQRTRREILNMVAEQQAELDTMVLEQHKAAGIHGFREAVKSGRLEVHPFRETSAEAIVEAMLRGGGNLLYGIDLLDVLEEYIDQVSGAVADGSTYPVFDDLTGDFVAEAVRAGLITATETGADGNRYGGISSDLLRRLPLFEMVSLSDVMDIRRELEGSLRGFRLAIASFSGEIRSVAWDPGFPDEADALLRDDLVPRNVASGERVRSSREKKEAKALSQGQVKSLLRAARGERNGALYVTAVHTGLRQGELLGLRWSDVDLKANRLSVARSLKATAGGLSFGPPKNKASRRSVPLNKTVVAALESHRKRQSMERLRAPVWHDLVFPNRTGNPMDHNNLNHREYKALLEKARLHNQGFTFHSLRHTFGTALFRGGEHPKVVQSLLGHASIVQTMDTYSHLLDGIGGDAVGGLEQAFS
jgi:integrase